MEISNVILYDKFLEVTGSLSVWARSWCLQDGEETVKAVAIMSGDICLSSEVLTSGALGPGSSD